MDYLHASSLSNWGMAFQSKYDVNPSSIDNFKDLELCLPLNTSNMEAD